MTDTVVIDTYFETFRCNETEFKKHVAASLLTYEMVESHHISSIYKYYTCVDDLIQHECMMAFKTVDVSFAITLSRLGISAPLYEVWRLPDEVDSIFVMKKLEQPIVSWAHKATIKEIADVFIQLKDKLKYVNRWNHYVGLRHLMVDQGTLYITYAESTSTNDLIKELCAEPVFLQERFRPYIEILTGYSIKKQTCLEYLKDMNRTQAADDKRLSKTIVEWLKKYNVNSQMDISYKIYRTIKKSIQDDMPFPLNARAVPTLHVNKGVLPNVLDHVDQFIISTINDYIRK